MLAKKRRQPEVRPYLRRKCAFSRNTPGHAAKLERADGAINSGFRRCHVKPLGALVLVRANMGPASWRPRGGSIECLSGCWGEAYAVTAPPRCWLAPSCLDMKDTRSIGNSCERLECGPERGMVRRRLAECLLPSQGASWCAASSSRRAALAR